MNSYSFIWFNVILRLDLSLWFIASIKEWKDMDNRQFKIDIFPSGWRIKLLLHHNVNRCMDMDNRNLKLDIFPLGWRMKLLLHHKVKNKAKDKVGFQAPYYTGWNESWKGNKNWMLWGGWILPNNHWKYRLWR